MQSWGQKGLAIIRCNNFTDLLQSEVWLRYVTSLEERKKILRACHVDSTAGHMGRERTYSRLNPLITNDAKWRHPV